MDHGTGIIDVFAGGQYQNASVEDPTTDLTQAAQMWANGYPSRSGERVTPKRSLSVAAVWQAITLISGDIAKLPVHFYERDDENGRKNLRTHDLAVLVRKKPNSEVTAFKFWRRMLALLLLYNNAYAWIQRDRREKPIALWPMLPPLTQHVKVNEVPLIQSYVGTDIRTFHMSDVLHFEGICINNACGEDAVEHAREDFGLALARTGYASGFFRNGGRFGGVLEVPTAFKEKARKDVEEGFRQLYESLDAAFKTYVARGGVKFHPGQFSPDDAQLNEGSRESNRDVARRYNLHPSKLGEEHKSAYNSKAEDNRDYLDTTLSPYLTQIVEELGFKLLPTEEFISDSRYFEHNTDRLLQLDPLKRAQQYGILRRNEIINPNEARQRENLPPRTDPGGDDYSNPNTKRNEAVPNDNSGQQNRKIRQAHRAVVGQVAAATLGAACQKLARKAAKDNWFVTDVPEVCGAVTSAVENAIRAYAVWAGEPEEYLISAFELGLTKAFQQRLKGLETKEEVKEALAEMQETVPEALASLIVKE